VSAVANITCAGLISLVFDFIINHYKLVVHPEWN